MRRIIAIIIFVISAHALWAQTQTASALTNNKYFENPRLYLSQLNEAKIKSDILIDRCVYTDKILNCNGSTKVTTINSNDWFDFYNSIKYSNKDTSVLLNVSSIENFAFLQYKSTRKYPIFFLDVAFKRIKDQSLISGEFFQGVDYLTDVLATENSYSSEHVFAASCLQQFLTGDNIEFLFNEDFFITNNPYVVVENIQADFDDGQGYRNVENNQTVKVSYGDESRYLELKFKLSVRNTQNQTLQVLNANFTLFRTGTDAYTEPTILNSFRSINSLYTRPDLFYYPESTLDKVETFQLPKMLGANKSMIIGNPSANAKLEIYTLIHPNNISGKLRKPFIVCDGFDPGDTRDYYGTMKRYSEDKPFDNDFRGLLRIMNGDNSPWYRDCDPNVDLIMNLQERGYDIIIVNFLDGAGDVLANADAFYGFLKQLNTSKFRDVDTEEMILVGPSMGGLITRIALNKFKELNENPNVKTWISFDSPHSGANIPLSLQYSVEFLSQCQPNPIDEKKSKRSIEDLKVNLSKLNSYAAKQMLVNHISSSGESAHPDLLRLKFNTKLDNQAYPILSKNYSITNGGKAKLKNVDREKIIEYAVTSWTYVSGWSNNNTDGDFLLFNGSRLGLDNDKTITTNSQIAYDNAPGGWNSGIYSLNYEKSNIHLPSSIVEAKTRTCFIPTVSALGIPVNRQNVHSTWDQYTGKMQMEPGKTVTPFDVIYGMDTNEEHMRISSNTRTYILNAFESDYLNVSRPIVRQGETIHQEVENAVSYLGRESLTFAGVNGNTFTIKSTAEVKALSDGMIVFLPGFSANEGSTLIAKIGNPDPGFRSAKVVSPKRKIDYSIPSPFEGKVVNYNVNSLSQTDILPEFKLLANPVANLAEIEYTGVLFEGTIVEVYGLNGEKYETKRMDGVGKFSIDLSALTKGTYVLLIKSGESSTSIKLIKQ